MSWLGLVAGIFLGVWGLMVVALLARAVDRLTDILVELRMKG